MKNAVASVKNVVNLFAKFEDVKARAPGVPGLVLVHGETGFGKTTAVQFLAAKQSAVWVRALQTWTPRSMLARLMHELGAEAIGSSADMVEWIAEALRTTQRPVFVDEGDYLTSDKRLVETLRDLHDLSNVPFVCIGMAGFKKEVAKRGQLAGRISQWIEFKPLDLDDAHVMTKALVTDIEISDDLLSLLVERTRGSARGLVVALSRIESTARGRWTTVDRKTWGNRELTLSSSQA